MRFTWCEDRRVPSGARAGCRTPIFSRRLAVALAFRRSVPALENVAECYLPEVQVDCVPPTVDIAVLFASALGTAREQAEWESKQQMLRRLRYG